MLGKESVAGVVAGLVWGLVLTGASMGDGAVLAKSGAIQASADGSVVWCVNSDNDSVSRISVVKGGYVVDEFALPDLAGSKQRPMGLALVGASGSEVYVASHDSDVVYVLDGVTGAVIDDLEMPYGSGPIAVAVSPDGLTAVVTLHRGNGVALIDVATRSVRQLVKGLRGHPWGISFTSNTDEVWIAHTQTDGENSFLTAIDTATGAVESVVIVFPVRPRDPGQISGDPDPIPDGGYILPRAHLAQPPGDGSVWFPAQYQNFDNSVFTPNSSIQATIHKIDLATKQHPPDDRVVLTAVYAHLTNGTLLGDGWNAQIAGPVDLAFDAAGTTCYLVNEQSNDVIVFPVAVTVERPIGVDPLPEIMVGDRPVGIAASPVSSLLFVLNQYSRDVSVIDADLLTEVERIPVTPVTGEPFSASVLLGAKLFHTSANPAISVNDKASCASCHPNGESDTMTWNFGTIGSGKRKTLSLLGQALSFGPRVGGLGQLHRAGDRDEVQDFDLAFQSPNMGGTGFLNPPTVPLGDPVAGLSPELDAMSDFVLSLDPLMKSPHRAADGSLTAAQVRGATIFKSVPGGQFDAECISCHSGETFTDFGFHNVGGFAPPPELLGPPFNTPSLVGAWDNSPYIQLTGLTDQHTLGGVLRNSRLGAHGDTSVLTRKQMRDLEAFLNVIDGQMVGEGIEKVVDTTPPRIVAVQPLGLTAIRVIYDETVDPVSAGALQLYTISDGVNTFNPNSVVVDTFNGNRVTLNVSLEYDGCDRVYTITPGPIQDVAGELTGGPNNAMDVNDPTNTVSFTLTGTVTVTFGGTGMESFGNVAQTAGFSALLSAASYNKWRLDPQPAIKQKGFVKFNFRDALVNICGLTDSSRIVDARFTTPPRLGHLSELQLRRCFKPWAAPTVDTCLSCPGTLTRTYATSPTVLWTTSGARAIGGTGSNPSEYHPTSSFDLAGVIDATATVTDLNARTEFASAGMTDAIRFWFDNPTINFGWGVEQVVGSTRSLEYHGYSDEDGQLSPVLSITFTLPVTLMEDCNENGVSDRCDIGSGSSVDENLNGIPDECEKVPCEADWDDNGTVNANDVGAFLSTYFEDIANGTLNADFDGNGTVNAADVGTFLSAYFASIGPCP